MALTTCLGHDWHPAWWKVPQGITARRMVTTRYGSPMLYDVFDLRAGRLLEVYGEVLARELPVLEPLSGQSFIEVGAGFGVLTIPLARTGPKGGCRALALEPHSEDAQLLAANVALAGLRGVETRRALAGGTAEEIEVQERAVGQLRGHGVPRGMPEVADSKSRVPVVTVDGVVASLGQPMELLKVHEANSAAALKTSLPAVLRGARATLHDARPWLSLDVSSGSKPHPLLLEELSRAGYSCVTCEISVFNPENWQAEPNNVVVPWSAAVHTLLCGHSARISESPWVEATYHCEEETRFARARAAASP